MILGLWECTGFRSGIMSADADSNPVLHLANGDKKMQGLPHKRQPL